jgi:hypothetical protein
MVPQGHEDQERADGDGGDAMKLSTRLYDGMAWVDCLLITPSGSWDCSVSVWRCGAATKHRHVELESRVATELSRMYADLEAVVFDGWLWRREGGSETLRGGKFPHNEVKIRVCFGTL